MKVGIMGGTFDPIHIGHLLAAQHALEQAELDEVWFMPTNIPPHKPQSQGASGEQRLEMVRLAVHDQPQLRECRIELDKGGISYSIETVHLLRELHPDYMFSYIIGADMVQYLPKWLKIDELVSMVTFIGLQRPGYQTELNTLPPEIQKAVTLVHMPQIELSSTAIRERVAAGRTVRYMVPDPVLEYMEVNRLYEA
ncbi:nicotinate-nucleotide adenylyltransferase [Paenibacillus sp. YYML68]|uniref:nicotinate-nucleotide adenylyltransferase n=1 Tax=Paenibacillus sp. YYML68 TaxID=2909250 RepID=UPI0024921088|nr:nicotinate-nucleotide adenylyltransferase [Paenibacillus sp. YYML68]